MKNSMVIRGLTALSFITGVCVASTAHAVVQGPEPGASVYIDGGAGAANVVRDANSLFDTGFAWNGGLGFGLMPWGALEIRYWGAEFGIDDSIVPDENMRAHSLVGDLRLNLTDTFIQPFVRGGVGFTAYRVDENDVPGGILQDDTALVLPAGAGVTWFISDRVAVQGSFDWNFNIGEEFVVPETDQTGDTWVAQGSLRFDLL